VIFFSGRIARTRDRWAKVIARDTLVFLSAGKQPDSREK
jgi:hypothetical protein